MSKLMKKKGLRTFLIIVLVIIAFVLFFKLKGTSASDNSDKYAGVDFASMSNEYQRSGQYSDYVANRSEANTPMDAEHKVDIFNYDRDKSKDVSVRDDVGPESDKAKAVQIKEGGAAVYNVKVDKAGYYNLRIVYYPSSGKKMTVVLRLRLKLNFTIRKPINLSLRLMVRKVLISDGYIQMRVNRQRIIREMRFARRRLKTRRESG